MEEVLFHPARKIGDGPILLHRRLLKDSGRLLRPSSDRQILERLRHVSSPSFASQFRLLAGGHRPFSARGSRGVALRLLCWRRGANSHRLFNCRRRIDRARGHPFCHYPLGIELRETDILPKRTRRFLGWARRNDTLEGLERLCHFLTRHRPHLFTRFPGALLQGFTAQIGSLLHEDLVPREILMHYLLKTFDRLGDCGRLGLHHKSPQCLNGFKVFDLGPNRGSRGLQCAERAAERRA